MIVNRLLFYLVLILSSHSTCALIIQTIFGPVAENNPAAIELLNSKVIQRLKYIDQSGPEPYFYPEVISFSRYDHSIGVYALLKKYNVSFEEQMAGLVHDASHTVFSHLGDCIFQKKTDYIESYQDSIHDWFLNKMGVQKIIQKYNLSLQDISPKNPKYTALEQEYPDMSADRIEYNLHTALVFKNLNESEIHKILAALQYKNKKWFFTDLEQAQKFASLSTDYTRNFWGGAHNVAMYVATSAAIKYALEKNIITADDMHFGVDLTIVNQLKQSHDPVLRDLLVIILNIDNHYIVSDKKNYDAFYPVKMRGIDPLVLQQDKLYRLSELSSDFKQDLQNTAAYAKQGIYLKFSNINDEEILRLLKT